MTVSPVDFFDLDSDLTPEEKLVRDNVRTFVRRQVLPGIAGHFERGTFPLDIVPGLAEMGLLGANLSGYGCAGLNNVAYGLAMQELERGDSGVRSFCSVQTSLCMHSILAYGSEEQKTRWLPAMARGQAIGCFALTEPDFGSNPAGMLAIAERTPGGFRLTGTKRWITNGQIADVAIVWARLGDEIRGFLVPRGTNGLEARGVGAKFSLRASITSELVLDAAELGEDALLPEARGLRAPLGALVHARAGIAFGAIGAALACYEAALEYTKTRVQFSRPIAGYQLVQDKLVYMLTEISKAQLVALRLMRMKDEGRATLAHASFAKRNNVRMALEVARLARDLLGANGIMHDYPVARHLANLEAVSTYEGTHDIHTLILGREITGLAAFE
jgi:glutaryl-CoA dehydrogenase